MHSLKIRISNGDDNMLVDIDVSNAALPHRASCGGTSSQIDSFKIHDFPNRLDECHHLRINAAAVNIGNWFNTTQHARDLCKVREGKILVAPNMRTLWRITFSFTLLPMCRYW